MLSATSWENQLQAATKLEVSGDPQYAVDPAGRLRILLVTEAASAGVGRHVTDLAEGFHRRGHKVHVLYSPVRLDESFRSAVRMAGATAYHPIPMRRDITAHDFAALWQVVSYVRTAGPFDIIHGHSSKGGGLSRLAALLSGSKSAYTPHAISTMSPTLGAAKSRFFAGIENALSRRTDLIIAVSDEEQAHMRSIGLRPRRMLTIPNGLRPIVFPSRDEARQRINLGADKTVIGTVGRLTRQKAPDVLLRAFASIHQPGDRVVLALVGTGDLMEETRALSRELGVETSVLFLGEQAGWQILPAFDVFALSSNYEGMPYVLLEAAAAGLPIVTTEVGGASLVVDPGANGHIVPVGDVPALATALADLVRAPERRLEFGSRSRAMASKFTVDRMVERTLAAYREVTGAPSRRQDDAPS